MTLSTGRRRGTEANNTTVRIKDLNRIRWTLLLANVPAQDPRRIFFVGTSTEAEAGYFDGEGDLGAFVVGEPVAPLGLRDGLGDGLVLETVSTPSNCRMKAKLISATPNRVAIRSRSSSNDPRMTW
jgi:hypothetical protein